jgi:hypothetical protein
VRFLGTFLINPVAVPPNVIQFMVRQLALYDINTLERYLERTDTKWGGGPRIRAKIGHRPLQAHAHRFLDTVGPCPAPVAT